MTLSEKLATIQSELVAEKKQYNKFGKYSYRSSEDILSSLKEHIKTHKVYVNLSDTIEIIGNRIYIKATATISDGKEIISVSAFAREPEIQKGMSDSQITGSASSYARKYALNGLFAIDDTKDADSVDNSPQVSNGLISSEQHQQIRVKFQNAGIDYQKACNDWNLKNFGELQINSLPNIDRYIADMKG